MFQRDTARMYVFARTGTDALGCGKEGGGSNPRRSPARRGVPAAFAALLTALATVPSATVAQTCISTPAVTGTPSSAPAAWTFGGTLERTDTGITCRTLTNGMDMTLGPGLEMGTGTPLTGRGIEALAEGADDRDVTVTGAAVIHSSQSGIYMTRDGTGLLGVELTGGRIAVTGAAEGNGIRLKHTGKAGADSRGIRIVTGADIDLSGNTTAGKAGILVRTLVTPAETGRSTRTVPVTVRITGGTIDVGTSAEGSEEGTAVSVNQHAKGDTAITVEPGASLGREGSVAAAYGIYVEHQATSEGDIAITHKGRIYGGHGIYVSNESTSERKGNIAVTTDPGSVTVAKGDGKRGINAFSSATGGTGDITVTHNGGIDAGGNGLQAYNNGTGDVTVTTGRGSGIVAKGDGKDGIEAGIAKATGTGDIAVTHNGGIDAARIGIFTHSYGTGHVTVTTGSGSGIVARGTSGINASVRGSAATGDVTVTHGGSVSAEAEGIYVSNRNTSGGTGTIRVTTEKGSAVTARKQGILVWHRGTGRFGVTVRGRVTGDSAYTGEGDTEYAGVRI